jgi:hypothetical protein
VPLRCAARILRAQTITATGYLNNLNSGQLDLGGASPSSGAGRTDFILTMDITACDFSSGDESYKLCLFGSNDVAFGNGNVELLAFTIWLRSPPAGRSPPSSAPRRPSLRPIWRHDPAVAGVQPDAAHLLPLPAPVWRAGRHHAVDHDDGLDEPREHQLLRSPWRWL